MKTPPVTVVVGAGIWGLTCARSLLKSGHAGQIYLLDSDQRAGGKLDTLPHSGFLVESAANGFLDSNPATLQLCRDLGLGDKLISASGTAARNRFVYLKGKLHKLPGNLWGALTTGVVGWYARWRVLSERWRRPAIPMVDESIADFARRRLGRELTETLLDAFVTGIWAGDPETLSVRSCFPRWHEWETRNGSLTGGMMASRRERTLEARVAGMPPPGAPRMWSLRGGLTELVGALVRECGSALQTGAGVRALRYRAEANQPWEVILEDRVILADRVVLAMPPNAQAKLLAALDADLAAKLAAIPSNAIAVVAVGFPARDVPPGLDGFGYLSPQREGRPVLGVQWCSDIYPGLRAPSGMALWRALVGGPRFPEMADAPDDVLLRTVRNELALVTGMRAEPEFVKIIRWPKAIPQYQLGHANRVEEIQAHASRWPGLFLGGCAFGGVALNDCVDQAGAMAIRVLALDQPMG
jgi:oxygen-dependent protoporphyrinogen oxidase